MLTAEGKTVSLVKFFEWLKVLELPTSERKASFQGPSLQIAVTGGEWLPHKGDLSGFAAPEAPPLGGIHSSAEIAGTKTMEGQSMAGTDESV